MRIFPRFPQVVYVLAGCLLLAGGPARSQQTAPAAAPAGEKWKWQPAAGTAVALPGEQAWWQVFADPLLDSLVGSGLAGNLDLKAAVSRVEEARARVKIAESYWYPSLRLNPYVGTQSLAPNRPVPIPVQDGQLQRFTLNTFQVPVDLSYEVDVWGRLKRQVQVNQLLFEAGQAEYRAVQLAVAGEITRIYLLLRTTDAERGVLGRSLGLRDSSLAVADARYRAGLTGLMDVERARTEVAGVRLQLESLRRSRTELELSLGVLLGAPSGALTLREGPIPAVAGTLAAPEPASLAGRRPDLVQAERQASATVRQVGVNKAALLPRLNLVGSAGLVSREAGLLAETGSATYLLGAGLSLPLFEGNRNRNLIAAAERQAEAAALGYQQRVLQAGREVETALASLQLLTGQLAIQGEALASARRTRQLSRELYVKGLTSFLDVVDAERTALELERQAVNLQGQQALYTLALIRALGGSW
ncbi:MAG: efflux transporter outer membrane subunit [Cytophagales bacterium]|nr:efflux transporter outer membrane subunit [Cytophagales bacterium]